MGYLVAGISFGLVGGPIIGAVLSDTALFGDLVSLKTPFYGAFVLVLVAIFLVLFFFHDIREVRAPFVFRPRDIIDSLAQVAHHPTVLKIMPVYALFMIANVTFYIFVDNYLTSAFGYGVIGGSVAMLVIGIALATSSTFLVKPVQDRFNKRQIVGFTLFVMVVSVLVFAWLPAPIPTYIPLFFFYFLFGVSYPTLLGLFSSAVSEADQGWVMGVTTAVFCLAGGIMSLAGGSLMALDIRLPFYLAAVSGIAGLVVLLLTWGSPAIRKITARAGEEMP